MKLGCSSRAYDAAFRAGTLALQDWLRLCAEELELDGVEIADVHLPADAARLREVKKLCTDLGLTLAGIAVTNKIGAGERRGTEMDEAEQWCDVAAYLGAPILRVTVGMSLATPEDGTGRVVGLLRRVFGERQPDRRRAWSDAAWALRRCADHAAERGVVVALENDSAGGIAATPGQLLQCLHDVGSPWLRLCVEPASLEAFPGTDTTLPYAVQARALLRDVRDDGSDASAHWPSIVRMLRLGGYRGFLLVDYSGAEDPRAVVPRAARHMRGLLHLLARRELLHETTERPADGVSHGAAAAAALPRHDEAEAATAARR
jgi:sugar phosphate isomerase/epimerase